MSDNEVGILILIVVLFGGILLFGLLFSIFKDLINSIFSLNYDDFKKSVSVQPQNIFTLRLVAVNYLIFRGFWVTVEIYSDFIIFKMFNKALVVKDFSQLKLTGGFSSLLIINCENTKLELALGKSEYNIIKDFLEEKND